MINKKIKEKRNKKKKDREKFKFLKENKKIRNGSILIVFTLILFLIVINSIKPKKVSVKVGDFAPYEIRATKDLVDEKATEKLKEQVMNRVEPRYRIAPSVQMNMKNDIKDFFNIVRDIKTNDNISLNKKISLLEEQSNIELTKKEYSIAIHLDYKVLNNLENSIYDIMNQIMSTGIKEEELEYEKENVKNVFESLEMSNEEQELGVSLINTTIEPNKFVDAEATQRKKIEEAEKVEPVIVKEYQVIVRKGDRIDENALELIKESGLLEEKEGFEISIVIGTIILIFLIEATIILYLYFFNRAIFNSSKLLILTITIIATIIISQGVYSISPYVMPLASVAMLVSILIDPRLALIINFMLSFLIGVMLNLDDSIIAMYLIGGSVAAFSVINASQRYNIFFNGLITGIVNVLAILAFSLIKKIELVDSLIRSIYGVVNGAFCAILTIGTLPLWENVFEVITPLKLLELSNPNQPLLKRLLLEAPGTYHHSIVVGNLSEAAAEAIGADPLIARAGSYYHDIGKLKRPYFFKENQFGIDNPHNKLNPTLSTLIITNHTKDGETLAEEYKLPKEIKDIIIQHHGDTFVAYFYHKALNSKDSKDIKIEDFRYKGPKPQTREAALVMLADSVEAAVRSIEEPNKGKIEEMIRNIIQGKLKDSQLDECDLTLKDLNTIANAFSNVILGIFHERIEYPKLDIEEIKGEN